jgi:hypothetical protein
LASRAPRFFRRLIKLMLALPPGSPVRHRALKRLVARGCGTVSRGDDEIFLLALDRNVEINNIGWAMTGIAERYSGHRGFSSSFGFGARSGRAHRSRIRPRG